MQIFFPRTKERERVPPHSHFPKRVKIESFFKISHDDTRTVRFVFFIRVTTQFLTLRNFTPQQKQKRVVNVNGCCFFYPFSPGHDTRTNAHTHTHTKSHEIRLLLLLMLLLGGGRKKPLRKSTTSCLNLFSILPIKQKKKHCENESTLLRLVRIFFIPAVGDFSCIFFYYFNAKIAKPGTRPSRPFSFRRGTQTDCKYRL